MDEVKQAMDTGRDRPTGKEKAIVLLALTDIALGGAALETENRTVDMTFASFVLFSGVWMLLATLKSSWEALQSRSWDQVPYQIASTGLSMELTPAHQHNRFTPLFTINYVYQGRQYSRSSKEDLNLPVRYVFGTPHKAEKYLDKVKAYKYGDMLFVNPENPAEAHLKTGLGRDRYGMLTFATILVVLPLLTFAGVIEWQ